MKKICYVATIPAVVHAFLREHIQAASATYQVTVVCNSVDVHLLDGLSARLVLFPIERKPKPLKDILVLIQLIMLFRRERFDIVHSHMPKTGLLGMLAAWIAGIPIRIHTFHGEVWATSVGWSRKVMKLLDKLVALLATDILAVSPSQRNFLENEGVLPKGRATVIGFGSACGVDLNRFSPQSDSRESIRDSFGINPDTKLLLFVGRLNRDKGMLDLAVGFASIAKERQDVALLLVGTEEDVTFSQIQQICGVVRDRLFYVTFTTVPEQYMAAADIFCLPSYREGLPMTILEAAACGVPSVASRIYGIIDAVVQGETGLLFPAGDGGALKQNLLTLISDDEYRQRLGEAARRRVVDAFSCVVNTRGMMSFYCDLSEPKIYLLKRENTCSSCRVAISISVVSHLQSDLVEKLLNDLDSHCSDIQFEVILTLNQREKLTFGLDGYSFQVKVVQNDVSKGFASNHNQAFQYAVGSYFCVMNPDIRLTSNPFNALINVFEDSTVGLVAPLMFGLDEGIEDSARRFPTPLTIICKAIGRCKAADYGIGTSPLYPDWVGGMFMLFPRSVFDELNGFDERYFLYYEDVDICGRLRLLNREVVLCPQARVTHHAQRTSHRSFKYLRWHLQSMSRFFLSSVYWRLKLRRRI